MFFLFLKQFYPLSQILFYLKIWHYYTGIRNSVPSRSTVTPRSLDRWDRAKVESPMRQTTSRKESLSPWDTHHIGSTCSHKKARCSNINLHDTAATGLVGLIASVRRYTDSIPSNGPVRRSRAHRVYQNKQPRRFFTLPLSVCPREIFSRFVSRRGDLSYMYTHTDGEQSDIVARYVRRHDWYSDTLACSIIISRACRYTLTMKGVSRFR